MEISGTAMEKLVNIQLQGKIQGNNQNFPNVPINSIKLSRVQQMQGPVNPKLFDTMIRYFVTLCYLMYYHTDKIKEWMN